MWKFALSKIYWPAITSVSSALLEQRNKVCLYDKKERKEKKKKKKL